MNARTAGRKLTLLALPFALAGSLALADQAGAAPAPGNDGAYPRSAGLPEGCNAWDVYGVTLDAPDLDAGTTVTLAWEGNNPVCSDTLVSLALKDAPAPYFDPAVDQRLLRPYTQVRLTGGPGSVALTLPQANNDCHVQLDGVLAEPLETVGPSGNYYSSRRGLPGTPENVLLAWANGTQTNCTPTTTTTQPPPTTTTTQPPPTTTTQPPPEDEGECVWDDGQGRWEDSLTEQPWEDCGPPPAIEPPPSTTTTTPETTGTSTAPPPSSTTAPQPNCAELGLTDVPRGHPVYQADLDADGDGYACDSPTATVLDEGPVAPGGPSRFGVTGPSAIAISVVVALALGLIGAALRAAGYLGGRRTA